MSAELLEILAWNTASIGVGLAGGYFAHDLARVMCRAWAWLRSH